MKICTLCGEAKSPGEFYRKASSRDGRTSQCKGCIDRKAKRSSPEQIRIYGQRYRSKPGYAEAQRLRERKWLDANPGKKYAYQKKYVARNRQKVYQWAKNREARKKGARGQISLKEWKSVLRIFGQKCFYCGSKSDLSQDHVIPLSRGGHNTVGNIVPACRSCNSRKNSRFIVEWKYELVGR